MTDGNKIIFVLLDWCKKCGSKTHKQKLTVQNDP